MRLGSVAFVHFAEKIWVPMALFMDPQKSSKHRFQYKFESQNIIHTFKNYFVTVFLTISFQFSSNKWYLNTPYIYPKNNSIYTGN